MPYGDPKFLQSGPVSRLHKSPLWLLLGPLVIVCAIILLTWNEGRAVHAAVGLADTERAVIEAPADHILPTDDGELVHVIGAARAAGAILDPDLRVKFPGQVTVVRTVEMFQWIEKQSGTPVGISGGQNGAAENPYSQGWWGTAIDSDRFKQPQGHRNPTMPISSTLFAADDARLGAFALDHRTLSLMDLKTKLKPEAPPGWLLVNENLYRGANPSTPAIGDVRVRYRGLPSGTTISVLARQEADRFNVYTTANDYKLQVARVGNVPSKLMVYDRSNYSPVLIWILRGAGATIIFIGFALLFGPIETLSTAVPFMRSIVRGEPGALAFGLTAPVTLATLAVVWIPYRPLTGAVLTAMAAASLYLFWRWHYGRTSAPVDPNAAKA